MLEDTLDIEDRDVEDSEYERYEREYGEGEDVPRGGRRKPRPEAPRLENEEPEQDGPDLAMTYKPGRFERGWLGSSLRPFYQEHLITDVLYHVKGGKEASVYCCRPAEDIEVPLLAAKVYRPRQFRALRNDKMYREGRPILMEDGRAAKKTDHRLMRAVGKKTAFGVQVEHTSWLMYEYTTLEQLYKAGAAVPKPVGASDNAILMEYRGDLNQPAPTLSQIGLDADEAGSLFEEVIRNIRLLLDLNMIHGDLSAYNILYWEGKVTLIDFPQVTSRESNRNAGFILHRDVTRVCEYFASQGVVCDPDALMTEIWREPEEWGGEEPL